jgi:bifunctional non-homologous end joining protein LigD
MLDAPILFSEHHEGDRQALFHAAAKLNLEGIVSKNADAPYRSERTEAWQKIKTVQKGKFPVIGFVKDLLVSPRCTSASVKGNTYYVGKVGTGWSRTVSSQIGKQLDSVVSPKIKTEQAGEPTSNTEMLRPEGCFGRVRSRG